MDISKRLDSLLSGDLESINAYLREVCRSNHVDGTKADMHIFMLRLDGNNRPRINDFAGYLVNRIVDYCIPVSERHEAQKKDQQNNTSQYTIALYRKAERLFTRLSNTGEVGELALSVLTQSVLHIPQILCKMVLKTNPEVHYHGADGIYGKFDTETNKYCLYWGESKIYDDINSALSDCFDSIKELIIEEGASGTRKERDLDLFRANLDFDDPALEDAILAYLDPDDESYLRLEYRGVCLIGYSENAYPTDFSKIEDDIFKAIESRIEEFKKKIQSRLEHRTPLDSFRLEVFVVPFSNVDELRAKFLELL